MDVINLASGLEYCTTEERYNKDNLYIPKYISD